MPSFVIVVVTPEIFSLFVKIELGFFISRKPSSSISKIPISKVDPNRFFILLSNLCEEILSPSKFITVSTKCSRVLGPAGPKTLEHLVDTVINFEGDNISSHRLLRSIKNRFGSTFEIGIFEMLEEGLREIKNPSSIFTNKENISGVTTTITNEGTRPLAVDIQALVNKTFYSNPRRTTTGISINRLHQILAVIEKHVGIKLSEFDCYVATGGGFEINDPSSDLGVAISILSSLKNIPPLASSSFIGELGLSGQVRKSNNLRTKIEEAVRLGIKNIVVPKLEEEINNNFQNLINIKEISNIKEAVDYSLSD